MRSDQGFAFKPGFGQNFDGDVAYAEVGFQVTPQSKTKLIGFAKLSIIAHCYSDLDRSHAFVNGPHMKVCNRLHAGDALDALADFLD